MLGAGVQCGVAIVGLGHDLDAGVLGQQSRRRARASGSSSAISSFMPPALREA